MLFMFNNRCFVAFSMVQVFLMDSIANLNVNACVCAHHLPPYGRFLWLAGTQDSLHIG